MMINVFNKRVWTKQRSFAFMTLVLWSGIAAAQVLSGSDSLPTDGPLCGFANMLRGPTALAIGTLAFFAAGASFLWGEEIAGMTKKLTVIVMGICFLIGGASFVGWIAVKLGAGSTSCSSSSYSMLQDVTTLTVTRNG